MAMVMPISELEPLYVTPGRPAAVYWRRRVVALVVAVVAVVALVSGARSAAGALGIVPASGPERTPASSAAVHTYVVQPGDTVWSIARRLRGDGDVRPLVHQIVRVNGSANLQIGDRLQLPPS